MGFIQDKRRGKVGERVVKGYFEAIGADIRDLSEESEYQAQDVDLIAADGLTYEVKTDYRFSETGNLALEDSVTNAHGRFKSWLWTSKADYFCFVDPNQESKFVAISAEDLRHLVEFESFRKVTKDDLPNCMYSNAVITQVPHTADYGRNSTRTMIFHG